MTNNSVGLLNGYNIIIITMVIFSAIVIIPLIPKVIENTQEREMLFEELNNAENCDQLLDNYESLIQFESEFFNDGKSELATKYFNIQSMRLKC